MEMSVEEWWLVGDFFTFLLCDGSTTAHLSLQKIRPLDWSFSLEKPETRTKLQGSEMSFFDSLLILISPKFICQTKVCVNCVCIIYVHQLN